MSTQDLAARIEHFLGRRYPVSLQELAPEEGGGYVAAIPQLGRIAFMAVGETPAEALEALDALRQHLIPELLAEGVELPEPQDDSESLEQYSGNLMLRIPRSLHARLAAEAKRNQTSINKLATQLLSQNLERTWLEEQVGNLSRQINSTGKSGLQNPT
jgi:antitoxin HicB